MLIVSDPEETNSLGYCVEVMIVWNDQDQASLELIR